MAVYSLGRSACTLERRPMQIVKVTAIHDIASHLRKRKPSATEYIQAVMY